MRSSILFNLVTTLPRFLLVFFAFAGAIWLLISTLSFKSAETIQEELEAAGLGEVEGRRSNNYLKQIGLGVIGFAESIYVGFTLVFTNRRFICEYIDYSVRNTL